MRRCVRDRLVPRPKRLLLRGLRRFRAEIQMQAHQRARIAARHLHCNNGAPVSALNAVALVTHLLHQQMHLFADLAAMHAGRFSQSENTNPASDGKTTYCYETLGLRLTSTTSVFG